MSNWIFYSLVTTAWLTYPIFGAAGVSAKNCKTDPPGDAGFSFFPELIVFPPIFVGVALAIDSVAMPLGRWTIGLLCVVMLVVGSVSFVHNTMTIHRANRERQSGSR